jgi:hypothetical protein
VSTRVDGAAPPVILITAKATMAAGTTCLCLTVTQESGNLCRRAIPAILNLPKTATTTATPNTALTRQHPRTISTNH